MPMTLSSTLQFRVTCSSPGQTVTSTSHGEKMARPSPTLMATVFVFPILACFSSLRATIESVVPVSKKACKLDHQLTQ